MRSAESAHRHGQRIQADWLAGMEHLAFGIDLDGLDLVCASSEDDFAGKVIEGVKPFITR